MPKFLETKLKQQYGADSAIPYKVMNAMGAMHGNKETAKGRAMERKHKADKIRKIRAGGGTSLLAHLRPDAQLVGHEQQVGPRRGGGRIGVEDLVRPCMHSLSIVLERNFFVAADAFGSQQFRASVQAQAFTAKNVFQFDSTVRIKFVQDMVASLDQRRLHAKAGEELRKFHSNRSAPKNNE